MSRESIYVGRLEHVHRSAVPEGTPATVAEQLTARDELTLKQVFKLALTNVTEATVEARIESLAKRLGVEVE